MGSTAKTAKSRVQKLKRRSKRVVTAGVAYIQATFNNTIVTICDTQGNVLGWETAGRMGFKGARKGTPFAAQLTAKQAAEKVKDTYGLKIIDVIIKGPGSGREAAARALADFFKINSIADMSGTPHNGCRPKKKRRV